MTLFRIELINHKYITSVEAPSYGEAKRRVWRKIAKKAPELVPYLRKEGLIIYPERGGLWGRNQGI